MVTAKDCLVVFGEPNVQMEYKHMVVLQVPGILQEKMKCLPSRIYCNRALKAPLLRALTNLVNEGVYTELKSWGGCFNVRKMRGGNSMSLHSWGIAIDVNADTNALGAEPTLSPCFVDCFTREGFEWGGTWKRKDGMHFQLASL
jgi:hypothetical protein